jgi:hypothetical protein
VPHPLISAIPERRSPTLWPPQPNDWTQIELAVSLYTLENRKLRDAVVNLSEIILNTVGGPGAAVEAHDGGG